MEAPRIQYARTKDGVNIALWTLGEGVPVVSMPPSPGHIQLEWEDLDYGRSWYGRMAQSHQVIRYDMRGTGLSDRDVSDFSLDALASDLDAVVSKLALETFALTGIALSGPPAMAYAARHPGEVSHLMLWCTYSNGREFTSPQFDALATLIDTDWELYTETIAHAMVAGWARADEARRFAAIMRAGVTAETFRALRQATLEQDASDVLPQITCPTQVVHRRDLLWPSVEAAKKLAARIPKAQLVLLEGTSVLPWIGDLEAVASGIERFLGIPTPAPTAALPRHRTGGGLVTILFTDLASSTALTQRLGDARAQELVRAHNTIVREALAAHGGTEIKHTGDGIMASCPSATGALECAVSIQRAVAERENADLAVKIGLNAGEPVAEESDLYGTAVQLARRVCDQASGGEILVSNVVRELAAGKDFLFSDSGVADLKGFDEPVRLFEVRWRTEDG